jgi:hypothetical protein
MTLYVYLAGILAAAFRRARGGHLSPLTSHLSPLTSHRPTSSSPMGFSLAMTTSAHDKKTGPTFAPKQRQDWAFRFYREDIEKGLTLWVAGSLNEHCFTTVAPCSV